MRGRACVPDSLFPTPYSPRTAPPLLSPPPCLQHAVLPPMPDLPGRIDVTFRRLPRSVRWLASVLLPATVLGFLAGCSGSLDPGYSSDFVYPSRKDPLVLSPLPAD